MYPTTNNAPTSLGLPEIVERVGAYAFFWLSGLLLLLFERKNQNVRHHARQSLFIFGPLFLVMAALNVVTFVLGWVPLLGGLLHALGTVVWDFTLIGWVVMMVLAAISPRFQLPGMDRAKHLLR